MLTYPLTKTGGVSLYEQLYRRIKDDILTGRLAAAEKLPSKRALAAHLEVSVITVKNAYEQLMAEGYIYGMEKRGYYVSPVQRPLAAQRAASPAAAPAPQSWEMDLVTNSIAAEDFPFTVWARLMRQTILEEGTGLLHAMPPQGAPELRTAIAAYLRQSGSTQEEAAALLGRSPSALANKLRLLRLSPDCCRLLTEHDLTERHARALLRLEDEEERLNALHHIIRQHLNVAQTEQYIDKRLAQLQTTPPSGRRVFLLKDVRLFLNSLDRGLRLVREAGIGAESRREDTEDAILLTIRIPKNRQVS